MRRNQLSSLILTNQISRKCTQNIAKPPYDIESINNDKEYISNKLDIKLEELDEFHKMPKKYYYDYRNQKKIFDLGSKILNLFSTGRRGGSF